MKELLDRLKKADPGTYSEWLDSEGMYWEEGYELSDSDCDILQGEIQRAIEAKGWVWEIFMQEDKKYVGEISSIEPGYDGDYYNEHHLSCIVSFEDQTSAASAILSAYLQALEANQ